MTVELSWIKQIIDETVAKRIESLELSVYTSFVNGSPYMLRWQAAW